MRVNERKNISEINLDLVFRCTNFSQVSEDLHNDTGKLILKSSYWEKVFLSWINFLSEKDDYVLPKCIFETKSFSLGLQIINNKEIAFLNQKWMNKNGPTDVLSFPIISDENLLNLDQIVTNYFVLVNYFLLQNF